MVGHGTHNKTVSITVYANNTHGEDETGLMGSMTYTLDGGESDTTQNLPDADRFTARYDESQNRIQFDFTKPSDADPNSYEIAINTGGLTKRITVQAVEGQNDYTAFYTPTNGGEHMVELFCVYGRAVPTVGSRTRDTELRSDGFTSTVIVAPNPRGLEVDAYTNIIVGDITNHPLKPDTYEVAIGGGRSPVTLPTRNVSPDSGDSTSFQASIPQGGTYNVSVRSVYGTHKSTGIQRAAHQPTVLREATERGPSHTNPSGRFPQQVDYNTGRVTVRCELVCTTVFGRTNCVYTCRTGP